MPKRYITRKGYIELVWQVLYNKNGFKYPIYVQGTEPEMQEYLNSELGFVGSYHACTNSDIAAIHRLGIPIYIAPKDE